LAADPQVGVIACAVDPAARSTADRTTAQDMARIHLNAIQSSAGDWPGSVFFNNASAGLSPAIRRVLDGTGIAYLQGSDRALRALGHWIRFHCTPWLRSDEQTTALAHAPDSLAAVLEGGGHPVLNEYLSAQLLRDYGMPVVRSLLARTSDEAVEHAASVGFPVVLKVVSAQLPHKSDVGGVILGLQSGDQVRTAFDTITRRVRKAHPDLHLDGVLVQPMVAQGLEMYLGVSVGVYGPCVLVGLGGIDVEQTGDVVTSVAPVDGDEARRMLGGLRGRALLGDWRGRPARDVAALVAMICNLSRLAAECRGWLAAVDINPVVVLAEGDGAYALDALVELRH
jgi:acyl-CoA synthetase (NDP forming)